MSSLDTKAIYKKLKIASDLFEMAMKIKCHQLSLKFPDATQAEIKAKALELLERGCR